MKPSCPEKSPPRQRRRWPRYIVLGVIAVLLFAALKTSRLGYESPDYEVVAEDGKFELRRYSGFRTVTATMKDSSAMNRGFGELFQYITGANEGQQKIAMTVPVLMENRTTPPSVADSRPARMSFVIPSDVAALGAPRPTGENVALAVTKAGDFAALRFQGFRDQVAIETAEKKLRSWIDQQGWSADDETRIAYYDPPWTPGFLRRNEILIPVRR